MSLGLSQKAVYKALLKAFVSRTAHSRKVYTLGRLKSEAFLSPSFCSALAHL